MRRLLTITLLLCAIYGMAQSVDIEKAEKIKADDSYVTGEGMGATLEEAGNNAIKNLLEKISVGLRSTLDVQQTVVERNGESNVESVVNEVVNSYTQGTLRNTDELCLATEPEFHVMRFIKRSEISQIFSEREDRVKDYVRGAVAAEKKGRIDNALRYYYWAYNLLKSIQSPSTVKYEHNGVQCFLLNWIPEQMRDILSKLKMETASIDKESGEVELLATYDGKPVTSIDFTYFDGTQWSNPTAAKDGMAQIEMRPNSDISMIQIRYEYAYKKQARQDSELEMVMNIFNGFPLPQANQNIKVGSKGDLKKVNKQFEAVVQQESVANNTAAVEEADSKTAYLECINKVVDAIKTKKYSDVRELFTPEGYQMFDKLVHYGNATLIGNPNISFYNVLDRVVCRSIPMKFTFRNNNRSFVEDLTLTFDDEKKIESLAFGLDQAAKTDIFNKAVGKWDDNVRMVIATFLENYKTAFALKRLDYIESIFDDNAVIITGSYVKQAKKTIENDKYLENKEVKYNKLDKATYLSNLEKCFKSNQFINVRFTDNDVSKLAGGQTFGIQIHQDYYSSSYSDTGYLFLMVDMNNPKQPIIKVRTWQPERDPKVNSMFSRDSKDWGLYYGGNFQ
ncbi:MAG: LPP20 family lipoprotein [Bacteroidaceae bacterium]|nr:LPP20 family lipoprotein [Bacteroidaceae bacterium]